MLTAGAATAGGSGFGVGPPFLLRSTGPPRPDEPVVAVVPAGMGYAACLPLLIQLVEAGRLAAVVMADDEAVLVANRLRAAVPVMDSVDLAQVLAAELVCVEVQDAGQPLRFLSDPFQLVAALRLDAGDRPDAARLAQLVADCGNAVVTVERSAPGAAGEHAWVEWVPAGRLGLEQAHAQLRAGRPGLAHGYGLGAERRQVDDLFTVDLGGLADALGARRGLGSRAMALSALHVQPEVDPRQSLAERLGIEVVLVGAEARAAGLAARTTPGTDGDTVAVDIGGGTIDVVAPGAAPVVVAGAGELLTVTVGAVLGTSRAAAEWVKRGASYRLETPQLLLGEDTSRRFLERPARADAVGSLVVEAPVGLLPFDRLRTPSEWRALRRALKTDILGGNLARVLRCLPAAPSSVVVVGGPAGDDEVLGCVAASLPAGIPVGRGNVGGELGHRYGVAYGLLLLLNESRRS